MYITFYYTNFLKLLFSGSVALQLCRFKITMLITGVLKWQRLSLTKGYVSPR